MFAAFVLANVMSEKLALDLMVAGIMVSLFFLVMGYLLNKN